MKIQDWKMVRSGQPMTEQEAAAALGVVTDAPELTGAAAAFLRDPTSPEVAEAFRDELEAHGFESW